MNEIAELYSIFAIVMLTISFSVLMILMLIT